MAVRTACLKICYDLGHEDGCELGCNFGMLHVYKFVQKKEQRIQTQRARRNARVTTQHRLTKTSLHTTHTRHNTDQYRGFKQTEEESDSPVLEARGRGEGGVLCLTCSFRREKQVEVDLVAGALLLPATISSSVWHN